MEKVLTWLADFFLNLQLRWSYWQNERLLGAARSPKWSAVSKAWRKENPNCAVCFTVKQCETHHQRPFHLSPESELDFKNFLTLCRPHHYLVGHLMNWSSFNGNVVKDAEVWAFKIKNRPK